MDTDGTEPAHCDSHFITVTSQEPPSQISGNSIVCSTTSYVKLFRGNKNIYLHFMSFLHTDMTQVVEMLPSSSKIRTYLFNMVNIMCADVLAPCVARASATMILTTLTRIKSVPANNNEKHQMFSNAEIFSMTWRRHVIICFSVFKASLHAGLFFGTMRIWYVFCIIYRYWSM